jgi:hypothetical protein
MNFSFLDIHAMEFEERALPIKEKAIMKLM